MRTARSHACAALCLLLFSPFLLRAQPGALDPSFNGTGHVVRPANEVDVTEKILVQEDEKILVIGMSWDADHTARGYAFRYLPDGSPDTDFANNGVFTYELDKEALFYSAVLVPGGKILLVGGTSDDQTSRMLLVQLNEDGSPDGSFGTRGVVTRKVSPMFASAEDMAYDVALDAQGRILVCGSSHSDQVRRPVILRFTPNGQLDTRFGTGGVASIPGRRRGSSSFQGMVVQPDGKIIATGYFGQTEFRYLVLLVRFNDDGSLDSTFGTGGIVKHDHGNVDDEADDITLAVDGSILVAGFTASVDYTFSALLLKFTPDGELDTSFGKTGAVVEARGNYAYAYDLAVQDDGRIIMGGSSGEAPPGAFHLAVWKYMADGTRDPAFGNKGFIQHVTTGYSAKIYAMELQPDGKILLGGQARTIMNANFFFIARLTNEVTDGMADRPDAGCGTALPNPALAGADVTVYFPEDIQAGAQLSLHNARGELVHIRQVDQRRCAADGLSFPLPADLIPGVYQLMLSRSGTRFASTIVIAD